MLITYVSTTFIVDLTTMGQRLTLTVRAPVGVLTADLTAALLVFSAAFGQWFAVAL